MAANFENFLISLDFPIHFKKSHEISKNYLESSESYGQKPLGGSLRPPGLNRASRAFEMMLLSDLGRKNEITCWPWA